jgi:hypothetical protein
LKVSPRGVVGGAALEQPTPTQGYGPAGRHHRAVDKEQVVMHRQIPAADAAVNQFICDVYTVLEEALADAEDGLAEQAERFAGSARFAMARERLEAAIEAMRAAMKAALDD